MHLLPLIHTHASLDRNIGQSQFHSLQGELEFMQANICACQRVHGQNPTKSYNAQGGVKRRARDKTNHPKSAASYHNNQATVHRAARLAQKKKKKQRMMVNLEDDKPAGT